MTLWSRADMFPAKLVLKANDKSIECYLRLARMLGTEGAEWKYEWGDGGRVFFAFKSDEQRNIFYACHFLMT
jgi:hypothetical protein